MLVEPSSVFIGENTGLVPLMEGDSCVGTLGGDAWLWSVFDTSERVTEFGRDATLDTALDGLSLFFSCDGGELEGVLRERLTVKILRLDVLSGDNAASFAAAAFFAFCRLRLALF